MTDRYRITQDLGGRWLLAHPKEPEWKWNGKHWSEFQAMTFADLGEAKRYADSIFSQKEDVCPSATPETQ